MQYQSSTVNAVVDFDLLDDAGCTSPVQAELRYDSGRPVRRLRRLLPRRPGGALGVRPVAAAHRAVRAHRRRRRTRTSVARRRRPRRRAHRAVARPTAPRSHAGAGQRGGVVPAPHRGPGAPRLRERPRRPRRRPGPSCSTSTPPEPAAPTPPAGSGVDCRLRRARDHTFITCGRHRAGRVEVTLVAAVHRLHVAGGAGQEHLVGLLPAPRSVASRSTTSHHSSTNARVTPARQPDCPASA